MRASPTLTKVPVSSLFVDSDLKNLKNNRSHVSPVADLAVGMND